MRVVADTSIFNYLIVLGQLDLLPTLYGRIVIPSVVLTVQLPHQRSPALVRAWARNRFAVLEWVELHADLVLMDDKDGRKAAELRGLTVYGTVGVLVRAAEQDLVDLQVMLTQLRTTSFRIDERILREAMARDAARKAAASQPPPPPEPQEA